MATLSRAALARGAEVNGVGPYQPRPDDDDLVNTREAAHVLSVSPKTLYNWKDRRQGPDWVKVGHLTKYRKGDLRRWLHEHTGVI
jgi:predicted DNA-binding transcriptional regulator AlpA